MGPTPLSTEGRGGKGFRTAASLETDAEAEFGPWTLLTEVYQGRNLNEGKEREQE